MTPAELDAFWQSTLDRLSREPMDAVVEQLLEPVPYHQYRVTLRSLGGIPIRAVLARPVPAAAAEPLPALISAPGYGGREHAVMLSDCQRGYLVLQVYPRTQGEAAELWDIGGADKLTWHRDGPEGHYYQGGYADIVRAVDYLVSRPDVDSRRIGMIGTSQGGGIALAATALDRRIKAVAAHIPFLCDMRNSAQIEGSLIHHILSGKPDAAASLDALEYFDPVNLAHRITVPALLSLGGQDALCPAPTIRAVFDRLPGIKALACYPDLIHTASTDFYNMTWEWIERYLR